MDQSHYTVSQAAKLLGVKGSVLRYWEEELDLRVSRNEQGHRCYTGYDIQVFMNIKELKTKGLQLRAIREHLPAIALKAPGSADSKIKLLTVKETDNTESTESAAEPLETDDKIIVFQSILERLIRQGLQEQDEGEHRYRFLDETIRHHQMARREAAASLDGNKKKRK